MARIIKDAPFPKVTPAVVVDARGEAQRVLREAEARAAGLIAEAERAADELRRQSNADGLRDGLRRAESTLEAARSIHQQALEGSKESIVRLAIAVASRLVRDELATNPRAAEAILEEQLARLRRAKSITVRICQRDFERAQAIVDERVTLVADAALEPGELLLESDLGEIDATMEARLRVLRELLTTELR